jgi:hypothetical protein
MAGSLTSSVVDMADNLSHFGSKLQLAGFKNGIRARGEIL